ncbi:hypothetical protein LUZ63_016978 [Rhynchospora breviuscula]|uniref:Uncharacterized protein n=1 Tax=Rhynchospora breviuscula TaxID=2022672 RepID=A0A9Q0HFY2_9POAL|nr:hypothetical protein LUZ63_016978 [Rhynchospora breviuscula]
MDSQLGTFGTEGAHCITIEEPSLLEKGEDKLGESGDQAEEEIYANTNDVMDSQEDTSSVEIHHAQLKIVEPSLFEKMSRKLTNKLRTTDDSQEVTIFHAPFSIRQMNKNMFEPSVVSIGPYYRGLPHLMAMEEKKWSFLRDVINSTGYDSYRLDLPYCIRKIKEAELRARSCYSEPYVDISSDDFVEMMILDGCFILEVLSFGSMAPREEGWNLGMIVTDLILLENQIPYFIIEILWYSRLRSYSPMDRLELRITIAETLLTWWDIPVIARDHLTWWDIKSIIVGDDLTSGDTKINSNIGRDGHGLPRIDHLLHLCLWYSTLALPTPSRPIWDAVSLPSFSPFFKWLSSIFPLTFARKKIMEGWLSSISSLKPFLSRKKKEGIMLWEIPSASELEEAGVKFKILYDSTKIITFKDGTLEIPHPCINCVTPLIINLVALEQCMLFSLEQTPQFSTYNKFPPQFSTYIKFMDALIDTTHDFKILQKNGMLKNKLSGEQEGAIFFNQIGTTVHLFSESYLEDLGQSLYEYCKSRYNKNRAKLYRDHFNSPWSIIALVAATLLLFLTVIQSFMSVYAYIHPPPSSPSS